MLTTRTGSAPWRPPRQGYPALRVLLVLGAAAALAGLPAASTLAIPAHPRTVATVRQSAAAVPAYLLKAEVTATNQQWGDLPKRVVTARIPGLSASAETSVLPYLGVADRSVAIIVIAYYTSKTAILLVAATVAIFTRDPNRRKTCVEIIRAISWWGRRWPPSSPESPT
jgi:hypothetical protein